ncbi:leucine zipper domain-containing protein [Rhodovulum sp. YEN HP10]|uniref:leucine zipper domain-containing protein n=1 Tax=Rhodovulum sp. HP10 TaxID=3387397 RepID=UPI0039E1337D
MSEGCSRAAKQACKPPDASPGPAARRSLHRNSRLTVYGRKQIVARVAAGRGVTRLAQVLGLSFGTWGKWLARFRETELGRLRIGRALCAR